MCQEPPTHQAETAGTWNVGLRLAISEIIGHKDRKNKRFYFIKVQEENYPGLPESLIYILKNFETDMMRYFINFAKMRQNAICVK